MIKYDDLMLYIKVHAMTKDAALIFLNYYEMKGEI